MIPDRTTTGSRPESGPSGQRSQRVVASPVDPVGAADVPASPEVPERRTADSFAGVVAVGYAVAATSYVVLTNRGELAGMLPDLGLVAASSLALFAAVRHVAREARRVRTDLVQQERALAR